MFKTRKTINNNKHNIIRFMKEFRVIPQAKLDALPSNSKKQMNMLNALMFDTCQSKPKIKVNELYGQLVNTNEFTEHEFHLGLSALLHRPSITFEFKRNYNKKRSTLIISYDKTKRDSADE